jgi:hypothetical protein
MHSYDGTTDDLALLAANAKYQSMIERLAQAPKPSGGLFEKYRRRANKALGYPATPDVGRLSSLISDLKMATEAKLGGLTLDRIVVTTPNFVALTQEDINDAIEYAGLRSWLVYRIPYPGRISEASAAFGANGNGLCKNYTDLYECQDEEEDMPWHQVMSISYVRHS